MMVMRDEQRCADRDEHRSRQHADELPGIPRQHHQRQEGEAERCGAADDG